MEGITSFAILDPHFCRQKYWKNIGSMLSKMVEWEIKVLSKYFEGKEKIMWLDG